MAVALVSFAFTAPIWTASIGTGLVIFYYGPECIDQAEVWLNRDNTTPNIINNGNYSIENRPSHSPTVEAEKLAASLLTVGRTQIPATKPTAEETTPTNKEGNSIALSRKSVLAGNSQWSNKFSFSRSSRSLYSTPSATPIQHRGISQIKNRPKTASDAFKDFFSDIYFYSIGCVDSVIRFLTVRLMYCVDCFITHALVFSALASLPIYWQVKSTRKNTNLGPRYQEVCTRIRQISSKLFFAIGLIATDFLPKYVQYLNTNVAISGLVGLFRYYVPIGGFQRAWNSIFLMPEVLLYWLGAAINALLRPCFTVGKFTRWAWEVHTYVSILVLSSLTVWGSVVYSWILGSSNAIASALDQSNTVATIGYISNGAIKYAKAKFQLLALLQDLFGALLFCIMALASNLKAILVDSVRRLIWPSIILLKEIILVGIYGIVFEYVIRFWNSELHRKFLVSLVLILLIFFLVRNYHKWFPNILSVENNEGGGTGHPDTSNDAEGRVPLEVSESTHSPPRTPSIIPPNSHKKQNKSVKTAVTPRSSNNAPTPQTKTRKFGIFHQPVEVKGNATQPKIAPNKLGSHLVSGVRFQGEAPRRLTRNIDDGMLIEEQEALTRRAAAQSRLEVRQQRDTVSANLEAMLAAIRRGEQIEIREKNRLTQEQEEKNVEDGRPSPTEDARFPEVEDAKKARQFEDECSRINDGDGEGLEAELTTPTAAKDTTVECRKILQLPEERNAQDVFWQQAEEHKTREITEQKTNNVANDSEQQDIDRKVQQRATVVPKQHEEAQRLNKKPEKKVGDTSVHSNIVAQPSTSGIGKQPKHNPQETQLDNTQNPSNDKISGLNILPPSARQISRTRLNLARARRGRRASESNVHSSLRHDRQLSGVDRANTIAAPEFAFGKDGRPQSQGVVSSAFEQNTTSSPALSLGINQADPSTPSLSEKPFSSN